MKKISGRVLSAFLALVMMLSVASVSAYAQTANEVNYLSSGEYGVKKLSKKEIYDMIDENKIVEKIFDEAPSILPGAHSTGKLTESALTNGLYSLNFARTLAGLKTVTLDENYNDLSQHGSVLLGSVDKLTHFPDKPSDMSQEFYDKGYESTSSSNIYKKFSTREALNEAYIGENLLMRAVWSFMEDSDEYNVDVLGHRRWQLNPDLGKTGMGLALNDVNNRKGSVYVTQYILDHSGTVGDYDFISWPASGNFPSTRFTLDTAWSVSLNPEKYQTPVKEDIKVTVEGNGEIYEFSGDKVYTAADSGAYFNVNTDGCGIRNCIIFRPDFKKAYDGVYTITISGIKDIMGNDVDFAYQVDFFDPVTPDTKVNVPYLESAFSRVQSTVKLTWQTVKGADGYQIFRSENPNSDFKCIKTIKDPTVNHYTNGGLEKGKTYFYKVRAYKECPYGPWVYSDFSYIDYIPGVVTFDNVYSNSTSRIRLLWNPVVGADGYQLWRAESLDGPYKIVKTIYTGSQDAYSNTGLEAGKTYYYKMRPFYTKYTGEKIFGAYSDVQTVAVMPNTPNISLSSYTKGNAKVAWNSVNGAAGYQLWRAEAGGGYSLVKSVDNANITHYSNSGLTSGKTYTYKVRAYTEVNGKKTFGAYSEPQNITVR